MKPLLRPVLWWFLGALVLLAATLLGVWLQGSVARDLGRMAEPERRALYERTLENLRTCARAPTDALQPYCEEQALFVGNFPECDDACRALARPFAPRSTR